MSENLVEIKRAREKKRIWQTKSTVRVRQSNQRKKKKNRWVAEEILVKREKRKAKLMKN